MLLVVCPVLVFLLVHVLAVLPVATWFVWVVASCLFNFLLSVVVGCVCALLLCLCVLVEDPVAAWLVWCIASCLLVVF